jgi:DNA-binding NtrC family response regulator
METFGAVLLGVWREACRHIELATSIGAIARMLGDHLPLAALAVREIDAKRSCLHTNAVGTVGTEARIAGPARTPATAEQMRQWLGWSRRGQVGLRRPGHVRPAAWTAMIPGPPDRGALIGPLTGREGARGIAVALARPGAEFTETHRAMFAALLEPLTAALDNDRRVRELTALRQAAEADRQSLLTRLGRRHTGEPIVGAETGLRMVMQRVAEVAADDAPVLILGEPGSGKEVIARAVHAASRRAAGPFIRVNCGAIPGGAVDRELFGQAPALESREAGDSDGWLQRVHGGTLFLDEIGTLPAATQARLLRVLVDGTLERLGDHEAQHVDVRIIAATDEDLAGRVRGGRFREDLWYRLAAFPILLPPLRERAGDIPALARQLAQRAAIRFGLPLRMPSADDVALLAAYPWPGNVRELATVMDRAALLGRDDRLDVAGALGVSAAAASPARAGAAAARSSSGRLLPLDEAMRQHIEAAVIAAGGRIEGPHGAAALLHINPHTLRARMRKLGVEWNRLRSFAGHEG